MSSGRAARRFGRMRLGAVAALASVLVGVGSQGGPVAAAGTWTVVSSPDKQGTVDSTLYGISCVSATFCMAVGNYYDPGPLGLQTLIERWDGTRWSITFSPLGYDYLYGVSCVSTVSCTAVGNLTSNGYDESLIESWNGTRWSAIPSPDPGPGFYLRGVRCVSTTFCMAIGYQFFSTRLHTLAKIWNGTSWSIVSTPNLGTYNNVLDGVACVSSTSCTAVGSYNSGTKNLIEKWDGTGWAIVSSPNTGATDSLAAVSCVSASFCTAAGSYDTNTGTSRTLIELWNGAHWSIVASPNVGTTDNYLTSVRCVSALFCASVGTYYTGQVYKSLAERWDGSHWSLTATANAGTSSNYLNGVACTSATRCTAVGSSLNQMLVNRTLIEAWAGAGWSLIASPSQLVPLANQLDGVSCVTTSSCVAVGAYSSSDSISSGYDHTLVEAWNGTRWSIAPSPSKTAPPNVLQSVSCASATFCSAVGSYEDASGASTLSEVWNGTRWSIVPSPNVGGSDLLNGVSCITAGSCVAVGYYCCNAGAWQTLVESWNGSTWAIVPSPNNGSGRNVLDSVSCTATNSCVGVGWWFDSGSNMAKTLVEHWNGTAWSAMSSPDEGIGSLLNGVSCVSASSCTAVGYYVYYVNGQAVTQTLAEIWNGSQWSVVSSPDVGTANNTLSGISCVSQSSCAAVGTYDNAGTNGTQQTLIEAWNGVSWSVEPSANQGPRGNDLFGVSCVSGGSCTAVGTYVNDSSGFPQTLVER